MKVVAFCFLVFFFSISRVSAQPQIPDARLRVTVQQREFGKLNSAYHVQELRCIKSACTLTTVTLNSCRPSPASNGPASPVVIEKTSTSEGSLKVSTDGNTLVTIESGVDIGGTYTTTQRFTYDKPTANGIASKLIGYSGGAVKNSVATKQVLTIEYVALQEGAPGGMYAEVKLNCPLGLPAVTVPLR